MAIFNWHAVYSVHHPLIDSQHKEIIDLFNRLYDSFNAGEVDVYDSVLDDLMTHAAVHFATEDRYMSDIGYADRDGHVGKHELFRGKVRELKEMEITDRNEACRELICYLGYWLLNHETEEDRKMVQELAAYHKAA